MSLARPFLDSSYSSSKGVKRKWSLRDKSTEVEEELPLCHSSSSSDSKASSATMSSIKETDEEEVSSMDLEFDFSLHLGNEKTPLKKKISSSNKQSHVDRELTLSSSPTSSVTSLSVITHQQQHRSELKGRKNYRIAHGGGKRCVVKSSEGSTDLCTVHGALLHDERVHGGATLGPLVTYEDMNVDKNVVTSSGVSEGRVHGGSLIAFLGRKWV